MKRLNFSDLINLIKGASFLSCGGGLSYPEQLSILKKLKKEINQNPIKILSVEEIKDTDYFATVAEFGPANLPPIDKSVLPKMLNLLTKKVGIKIKGLIPVEIGQEAITIESALKANLPIVNTDICGLRAVPKLKFNALTAQNVKFFFSPFVVYYNKKIKFFPKLNSIEEEEATLKNLLKNKTILLILGGIIKGLYIKKYLNFDSYFTTINIGKNLKDSKFTKILPNKLLFSGEFIITDIKTKEEKRFFKRKVLLKGKNSSLKATLEVMNEYMKVILQNGNQKTIYNFPQFICVLDPQTCLGKHSSTLNKNETIKLYVFEKLFDY